MELTEFWTICSGNGIILEVNQLNQFKRYYDEILYWNEKVNLISRKDLDNIYERHFLHSLSILKYVDLKQKAKCLDIGSGGGFPGIPLGIARPDLHITMVDSIAKKIKLTDMFAKHTGNRFFTTKNIRVETLCDEPKNLKSLDYFFARAVTRTVTLMGWTHRLLKDDGKFVLLKGGDMSEEIENARKAYPQYKYELIDIDLVGLPWLKNEEKKILVINK